MSERRASDETAARGAGEGDTRATDDGGTDHADVSHAARSGLVQVLTIAGQALLTVTHVLLARLFGRATFGAYQTGVAILEVLTRGGTGGADKGMLRYVAGHRARGETELVERAMGTGLRLCVGIAGTFALGLILAAGPVARLSGAEGLHVALRLMAPAAVFTGCTWVLVQASLGAKVTRANFIVRGIGEPSLLLLAGVLAALVSGHLEGLALAHSLAAAATLLLAIVVVGRVFGPGHLLRSIRAPRLAGFAKFSLPIGFAEMSNAILQRADVVLLTLFVGTSAAAVYAAAEFISRVVANIRYAFDSIAAAVFSEALHLGQRERLRQNLVMMSRWVASVAAPIATVVLTLRLDLLSLYGSTFREGGLALIILAFGHLVNATIGLTGWILMVAGRSRTILVNQVLGAAVNIALGLLLIPRFGLVGTAIAALGSVTLLQLAVIIEVAVDQRVHMFQLALAKPFVAAAGAFLVERWLVHHVAVVALRVVSVVVLGGLVYLGGLVLLGLPPEEKRLLAGLAGKARRLLSGRRG